jgi:branched-chain amino acid aminotransferase
MSNQRAQWVYIEGKWTPWADAKVHVSTHALHYGSVAFEGIRAYEQERGGSAVFRLDAHIRRLFDTCKLMRMPMSWTRSQIEELCVESVSRNGLRSCYIRPLVMRGAGGFGLYPMDHPVELVVMAAEWGRYLGNEAIENGVDAMVSSWRRFNASTAMPLGKIGGQYVTSQFASVEARDAGFAEAILLDAAGNVTEGAGENLFAVKDGELITPPLATAILGGITRDSVIRIARDLGIPVRFEAISRDMLYLADELFMTGTAAEITPVRSVDRIAIGAGRRGEITASVQQVFFELVEGRGEDVYGWLTPVPVHEEAVAHGARG